MSLSLGLDVGTVSAKWALIGPRQRLEALADRPHSPIQRVFPHPDDPTKAIGVSAYRRIHGRPLEASVLLLQQLFEHVIPGEIAGALVTGSAAKLVGSSLGLGVKNEFKAAAVGVGTLYKDVQNVFEMGGENSKFIRLSRDNGMVGIVDYQTNGDCAAGTGSFMDQRRHSPSRPSGRSAWGSAAPSTWNRTSRRICRRAPRRRTSSRGSHTPSCRIT